MNRKVLYVLVMSALAAVIIALSVMALQHADAAAEAKSKVQIVADARAVGFEAAPLTVELNGQTLENPHATRHLVTLYVAVDGCLVRLDRTIGTWESQTMNGAEVAKYQTAGVLINGKLAAYPVQFYATRELIQATLAKSPDLYPC